MSRFERRADHAENTNAGARSVETTPGRQTAVGQVAGGIAAQIVRSARGALDRYRRLAPVVDAAARGDATDPMVVLDARAALRRADDAIDQLGRLRDPDASAARDELIAERDATAPRTDDQIAARKANPWRVDAMPIAARLGLGAVDVRSDDQARSITEGQGARGVALGSTVYMHPDRVQPGTADGREVLAHELVHLAQARVAGAEAGQHDRDAAELEADELAGSLAAGGMARAPTRYIDLSRPAADQHAKQVTIVNGERYLWINWRHLWDGVRNHLAGVVWPDPHPRMRWVNRLPFFAAVFRALAPGDKAMGLLEDFTDPIVARQYLHPGDPYLFIDQMRPILGIEKSAAPVGSSKLARGGAAGPADWKPAIGVAVGQLFEAALLASMRRLAPRFLAAADAASPTGSAAGLAVSVAASAIPLSAHMDRAVVHGICAQGAWDIAADPSKKKGSTRAPTLRSVKLEWQGGMGAKDPALWNWVRAITPADATAEEVAAAVYAPIAGNFNAADASFFAYELTAAPPFFGVPGRFARHIPDARAHAPANATGSENTAHGHHVALAGSKIADELALGEVKDEKRAKTAPKPSVTTSTELIDNCMLAANYIAGTLGRWGLGTAITSTLKFLETRQAQLTDANLVARWQPVLEIQHDSLSAIGVAVGKIDAQAGTLAGGNRKSAEAAPLREILEVYGDAAASSHLVDTSRRLIDKAAGIQSGLTLRSVQGSSREVNSAMDMARDSNASDKQFEKEAASLADKQRAMSSALIAGRTVDPVELDLYTVDSGVLALRAKISACRVQLRSMEQAARSAGDGFAAAFASLFSGEFRDLPHATQMFGMELTGVELELKYNYKGVSRQENLRNAQAKYEALAGNGKIKKFLEKAADLIKWQQIRTAAVKIAALIGVSIFGGVIGGLVTRAVGGLFVRAGAGAAMGELGLGARFVSGAAGMVTDTAIASAGKTAIYGGNYGTHFLENLIENVGSFAVMKSLTKNAKELERAQLEASKFWSTKGGIVLKETAAVTGHGIMGIALGYVSSKIVTGHGQPPPETAVEWMLQGASMAIGRYVGHGINHHIEHVRKIAAIRDISRGEALLRFAIDVQQQAKALETSSNPKPDAAIELMAKRHELLMREIEALEMVAKRPDLMKKAGLHIGHIKTMQRDLTSQLGEVHAQGLAELPLHLSGMQEVVPGAVWKGSRAQIERGINGAERAGVDVRAKRNDATRTWDIEINGRKMQVHERDHAMARHGKPPPGGPVTEYKGKTVEAEPAKGERALTTELVPGSSFKGDAVRHANHGAEVAHAKALEDRAFNAAIGMIGHIPGVRDIQVGWSLKGERTLVLTLEGPVGASSMGRHMTIDVIAGPVPGKAVALGIANPSKRGSTMVGGVETPVLGRHTIELSVHMKPEQVERAVAGQIGTLVAAQRTVQQGKYARPNTAPDGKPAPLGPNDVGRAAEMNMMAIQMRRDPGRRAELRGELAAMVEHLGLRKGLPGADERASILDPHLTREARTELELARRPHDELDAAAKAELARIDRAAWDDLHARAQTPKPGDVHALPPDLAPKGQVADHAKVAEAARIAARVREMISDRTMAQYRDQIRALKPGEFLTVDDLMLGGGAALAARRPGALLVDARGRWQADGSTHIAQTAHQLDKLRTAGLGDPRQVAGPNDRVPIEAIRYWEDTIAAQGPVINGTASFRTAPDGRLLIAIKPNDGSAEIVVAVRGTPTIATGFPTERAPGAAFNTNVSEAIIQIERQLGKMVKDPAVPEVVRTAGQRALQQMAEIKSGNIIDGTMAYRAIEAAEASIPQALRPTFKRHVRGLDANDKPHFDNALKTLKASSDWTDLRNKDNNNSLFLGDEANLTAIRAAATAKNAPKHWIIGGNGGTGISAAEIILDANPTARVTMLGRESPAGLKENDQFRKVEQKYGKHGQKRFEVVDDKSMDLTTPVAGRGADGRPTYEAWKKGDKAYTGDGYIAALGREQQVPPLVADLVMAARRAGGDQAVKYVPRFDGENQYVGYAIEIRMNGAIQRFEVTGGVSRFVPRGRSTDPNALKGEANNRVDHASSMDAPSSGGNFDASFVTTAMQAYRYALDRAKRGVK